MEGQFRPEQKSINSLAFEHYLRTGQRFTAAEFAMRIEAKFNHNHGPDGRFTFGLGGGEVLSKPSTNRANASMRPHIPQNPGTHGRIMRPAAPSSSIAEVSGYPESGKTTWRSANDSAFAAAADAYNRKYRLSAGQVGYRTPEFMKAWAMVESGGEGSQGAFLSDPFQVNKPGDWADEKAKIGLRNGQKMTPETSALAALEWLRKKSVIHDGRGGMRVLDDAGALERYNANRVRTRQSGKLLHSVWYASTILRLAKKP